MNIIYNKKKLGDSKKRNKKINSLYNSFSFHSKLKLKNFNDSSIYSKQKNNKLNKLKNNKNKEVIKKPKKSKSIYEKIIGNLEVEYRNSIKNIGKNWKINKKIIEENNDAKLIKSNNYFKKIKYPGIKNKNIKLNPNNKTTLSKFTNDLENNNNKIKKESNNKININSLFSNSKINSKLSNDNSENIYQMYSTNSLNFKKDIKMIKFNFEYLFEFLRIKFLKNLSWYNIENLKRSLLIKFKKLKKNKKTDLQRKINYIFDIYYKNSLITEEINLISLIMLIKEKLEEYYIELRIKKLKLFLINLN